MTTRYLITQPTLAVTIQACSRTVITVPKSSIIEASQPVDGFQGLIEVTFQDETVLMFAEDIRLRGILVVGPRLAGSKALLGG